MNAMLSPAAVAPVLVHAPVKTCTCMACRGTGNVWDPGDPEVGAPAGYVTCPACDGMCVVADVAPAPVCLFEDADDIDF